MADIVEEIKSKIGIEQLVSQYVQLKKTGRNFKGLCPFHSEKTPSFIVSPEKQICHCFGCNKGGDIFTFIQELEAVSFKESLQILADKAGVKIEKEHFGTKNTKSDKDIYFKAHELASDFFEKELHTTNDGKKVLEYLYSRGLKEETIKEFKIGFAPDSYDSLYPYLIEKGIPKDILMKSGLIAAKNLAADNVYDKYRARLMFPIFNYFGKICGFGGRALKKDQAPKYLNSPENIIYNKSRLMYGLSHGKSQIKEKDEIILVEGYFDVVLPYQAGVKNTVATSGTALSEDQAKLIKRLTTNVVSCFDNDKAGFEATKRAYSILRKYDINMRSVENLDGKDPADFILKNDQDFEKIISEARDFTDVLIDKMLVDTDADTIQGRRKILKEMAPLYNEMSPVIKDFFVRKLSTKIKTKAEVIHDEIRNLKLPTTHPARVEEEKANVCGRKLSVTEILLALLFEYPNLFGIVKETEEIKNITLDAKSVYNELFNQYNSARGEIKAWDFDRGIFAEVKDKINILRLYAEELYGEFSESALENELSKLIDREKKDRRIKRLKDIQSKIEEAEKSRNKEELKKLLEEQTREIYKQ